MGLMRAGFEMTGVDIEDHSDGYPGEFVQGDAVRFIQEYGHEFDFISAHPPCQDGVRMTKGNRARAGWSDNHVQLIPATRDALSALSVPWVIENGPSEWLRPDVVLCGLTFGLPTIRHRAFEFGGVTDAQRAAMQTALAPHHHRIDFHPGQLTAGYRHGCRRTWEPSICPRHGYWCRATVFGVYGRGGGKPSVEEAQRALGIDWMTDIADLNEAIPPAYADAIGRAVREHGRVASCAS